jgi:hypothetical protein
MMFWNQRRQKQVQESLALTSASNGLLDRFELLPRFLSKYPPTKSPSTAFIALQSLSTYDGPRFNN